MYPALLITSNSVTNLTSIDGNLQFHNILAGSDIISTWDGTQRRYFLKDHLGSIRTTVDQSGNVDGFDDYYPFGLGMPNRSDNSANDTDKYKFTGHERDTEASLTLDYMMARNYDPALGRFLQIDPLAVKYPNLSPYTYVANNPLAFIDPTGMVIEAASQEEWDKQKGYVINKRDKLQRRSDRLRAKATRKGWSERKLNRRLGNTDKRIASLNSTIETFGTLESSTQVYSLQTGAGEVGGVSYDSGTGNIVLNFSTTSNFVHEVTHAGQFESGDLVFDSFSGNSIAPDLQDEVNAYLAEFAFDGSSIKGLGASSFSAITSSWVQGITTSDGVKPYANFSKIPIDINSTLGILMTGYPSLRKSLSNAPIHFTLKNVQGAVYKK